jgi:hypothetical protein
MSEHIAAVQQHLAILEGLKSKNKDIARRTFIRQTISYWNTQYGLNLSEKDLSIIVLPAEVASTHKGEIKNKVEKASNRAKHSS